MDPNRPFKCEVCKESFTQKNILLVHYNSVSHLHRLKKSLQGEQGNNGQPLAAASSVSASTTTSTSTMTPEKSSKSSALEALLGNIRGEKKEDDEAKPFKCNICKVAYSQGSTLDIHIRSVLHQTKAAKLQELIQSGQIDMSKPLIEQPEPAQLQEQHKKMIQDILLSPKSLNSTGSSNPQTSPNLRSSSPVNQSPQSSPMATLQSMMSAGGAKNEDEEAMMKNLAKTFPMLSHLTSTPTSASNNEAAESSEAKPDIKNLLQNFGLDMVKQFTEMQQKRQREIESTSDIEAGGPNAKKAKEESHKINGGDESPNRYAYYTFER